MKRMLCCLVLASMTIDKGSAQETVTPSSELSTQVDLSKLSDVTLNALLGVNALVQGKPYKNQAFVRDQHGTAIKGDTGNFRALEFGNENRNAMPSNTPGPQGVAVSPGISGTAQTTMTTSATPSVSLPPQAQGGEFTEFRNFLEQAYGKPEALQADAIAQKLESAGHQPDQVITNVMNTIHDLRDPSKGVSPSMLTKIIPQDAWKESFKLYSMLKVGGAEQGDSPEALNQFVSDLKEGRGLGPQEPIQHRSKESRNDEQETRIQPVKTSTESEPDIVQAYLKKIRKKNTKTKADAVGPESKKDKKSKIFRVSR